MMVEDGTDIFFDNFDFAGGGGVAFITPSPSSR
jgi:hypothetical protein